MAKRARQKHHNYSIKKLYRKAPHPPPEKKTLNFPFPFFPIFLYIFFLILAERVNSSGKFLLIFY
jgi:hypothetical protein